MAQQKKKKRNDYTDLSGNYAGDPGGNGSGNVPSSRVTPYDMEQRRFERDFSRSRDPGVAPAPDYVSVGGTASSPAYPVDLSGYIGEKSGVTGSGGVFPGAVISGAPRYHGDLSIKNSIYNGASGGDADADSGDPGEDTDGAGIPGEDVSPWEAKFAEWYDGYAFPPFRFDLNGEELYQQYKDEYQRLGRQAMQDTAGIAAGLTGGYGSTYAQTAGQQAYREQLAELDDIVPDVYAAAYERWKYEQELARKQLSGGSK